MEMHQVRYFLAVARTLNFTRAADECNVTQPSLTRAIKQLEAELGGDLFRRERPTQLTELGQRMRPLLNQCYDAAVGARSLALSFKSGEIGALRIALTHSVDLSLLIPFLNQIKRQFNRLEFKFLRGNSRDVAEMLKKGDAELGIAAELGQDWGRSTSGRCSRRISSLSSAGSTGWPIATALRSRTFVRSHCCRAIIANTPTASARRCVNTASTSIVATKSPPSAT
jgi:DNA-binding transcriptional LysR family regulator